jgi:hypothetical protein
MSSMSKVELINKCKELGIKNYSSKNKAQLQELINTNQISLVTSNIDNVENTIITTEKNKEKKEKSKKKMIKGLKPIIKWSGGKSDEIHLFEKYIPTEYDTYLEPFVVDHYTSIYHQKKL